MAVVIMRDGTWHAVTDDTGELAKIAVRAKARNLEINQQMISVSSIAEVVTDERFDVRERQRAGERQCKAGFWHAKFEICGHTIPADENDLPLPKSSPKPSNPEWREKWLKILTINSKRLTEAGMGSKVGLIKTFAELEVYEKKHKFPEYVSRKDWPRVGANGEIAA